MESTILFSASKELAKKRNESTCPFSTVVYTRACVVNEPSSFNSKLETKNQESLIRTSAIPIDSPATAHRVGKATSGSLKALLSTQREFTTHREKVRAAS